MDHIELTPILTLETAGLTVVEFVDPIETDDLGYFAEYFDAE